MENSWAICLADVHLTKYSLPSPRGVTGVRLLPVLPWVITTMGENQSAKEQLENSLPKASSLIT